MSCILCRQAVAGGRQPVICICICICICILGNVLCRQAVVGGRQPLMLLPIYNLLSPLAAAYKRSQKKYISDIQCKNVASETYCAAQT